MADLLFKKKLIVIITHAMKFLDLANIANISVAINAAAEVN